MAEFFGCTCTGQGGSTYSSDCPKHDPAVDVDDPHWRARYEAHRAAQARVAERLGW